VERYIYTPAEITNRTDKGVSHGHNYTVISAKPSMKISILLFHQVSPAKLQHSGNFLSQPQEQLEGAEPMYFPVETARKVTWK
jgi:hypothetical protein